MKDDALEIGFAPIPAKRDTRPIGRPARRRAAEPASAAAFDEVFARLARTDSSHGPIHASEPRPLDTTQFRDVATQLDRQLDRLTRLLREIDGGTASD